MTPLAHAILKDSLLRPSKREFNDQCGLIARMTDIHCFDVTAVFELAADLCEDLRARGRDMFSAFPDDLAFLPAPKTWVEMKYDSGRREGVLLESFEQDGAKFVQATWACRGANEFASQPPPKKFIIPMCPLGFDSFRRADRAPVVRQIGNESEERMLGWTMWVYAILALINTPRIICRRQHMPHRGLERLLRRPVVGTFPLHAWTEIELKVTPPEDYSDRGPAEAHLTGRKALHFCRAHLRIRLGRLEFVSAHWRGDEALGTRRSRYRLAA